MKKVDEQFEFNKLNCICFFQNKIIHDRKNREKKNIQYTDCFNSAFNALVNKNYDEAKIACKSLRKRCLQWLLYFEYEFYCNVFKERIPLSEVTMLKECIPDSPKATLKDAFHPTEKFPAPEGGQLEK